MCDMILIIIFFFAFEIESGKIRPNFDEIFDNEWDKKEHVRKVIKIEQNEQNENSQSAVDQMVEEMGTDPIDQMGEYSNQNMIKNNQNFKMKPNDQPKRKIIEKFEAIKEKLREKGKYENKDRMKIEMKIGKLLGVGRNKIYKWKKELNLNKLNMNRMKNNFYDEKKKEFIERFDEFKSLYAKGKQKKFVKDLGISHETFIKWKKELIPNYYKTHNKYSNDDKLMKMKQYFGIKEANPKIGDEIIAGKLEIRFSTLRKWKKEF